MAGRFFFENGLKLPVQNHVLKHISYDYINITVLIRP